MNIRTNITTPKWPTMSVAQATPHCRLGQGCAFSSRSTIGYGGQQLEANLDKTEVGS